MIGTLPHLQQIDLSSCFGLDRADAGFGRIGRLANLTYLDVGSCHVDDACIDALTMHAASLVDLMLAYAEITEGALDQLAERLKLRSLSLEGCCEISEEGYTSLRDMPHLKYLSLRLCADVTDGVIGLIQHLPCLAHLDIRECDLLSRAALDHVASVPTLRHLCLSPSTFGWVAGDPNETSWLTDNFAHRISGYHTDLNFDMSPFATLIE
jgi:hypothetical protein